MRLPDGFRAAGAVGGIKPSGKPDLALLASDRPLAWALTTTQNRFVAACVTRARSLLGSGEPLRAVVVNSGNANCATGAQGVRDDEALAVTTAATLGDDVTASQVLTASTGVIGVLMPMEAARVGITKAAGSLGEVGGEAFAKAILTTDLTVKTAERILPGGARVVGVTKGSGMIHPNMATMLAFVMTDAIIAQATLRDAWPGIVDRSFNQVTVDGDTSTNDMAAVLASGVHEVDEATFLAALEEVAIDLAEAIAADGEGATTMLRVRVTGAASDEDARTAARAVAGSSLVKAAMHGRDPNWGRILSAAGQTGVVMQPEAARVSLQGRVVYDGRPLPFDANRVSQDMNAAIIELHLDLAAGGFEGRAWGCDLTAQYVRINADYTT